MLYILVVAKLFVITLRVCASNIALLLKWPIRLSECIGIGSHISDFILDRMCDQSVAQDYDKKLK